MRQLAKFSITVRKTDFVLHFEDEARETLDFAASPEQLDAVIDLLDELISEREGIFAPAGPIYEEMSG